MRNMRQLRWLPPLPLAVGALASGVLLALAYPPASMGSIAFVALIPVIVALYKKPYPPIVFCKTGYLFGVAFFLGHLWWIVGLVPSASITMPWLMAPALILLTVYLSIYPAVTFWLLRLLGKRGGLAAVLVAPALWALTEMFRSSSELGFPWGVIGYSIVGRPMLIQTAAFWGLFGLGMLIVFINMVWSQAFLVSSRKSARLFGVLGAVLLLSTAVYGQLKISKFESTAPVPETTVAIAQPNVDLRLKWDPAFTDSTFRLIERFCREADTSGAEIVVFPETCAPVYIRYKPNYMNHLSLLAEELDLAIYIGFLDGRYEGPNDSLWVYNSSGLFDKNHVFGQYDKTHLLPFGEAIPFAWKYPSWGKLDFGQANFHPGP
ncbi:MAG: apolipoprotein N-acyltransferase, partial [Candidatus Krumholzibacteria bacterium]|nr:apolipoprotein N-acyltransferase [Candidatus Krumholzibacteria bacterium]